MGHPTRHGTRFSAGIMCGVPSGRLPVSSGMYKNPFYFPTDTPFGKYRAALGRNKKGNKRKVTLPKMPWDNPEEGK